MPDSVPNVFDIPAISPEYLHIVALYAIDKIRYDKDKDK